MFTITLTAVVLLGSVVKGVSTDQCVTIKQGCSCKFSNGSIVDISALGNQDKTPRFTKDVTQNGVTYTYYYNPCFPFNQASCKDVAACQKDPGTSLFLPIGLQNTAKFLVNATTQTLSLEYQNNKAADPTNSNRTTHVDLVCANKVEFDASGDVVVPYKYVLTLKCPQACPQSPTPPPPPSGLSTGSVLLIIFFVGVFVYLVGGMLFLRFARGAAGVEMIPNREFWADLPGLMLDGAKFFNRCICGTGGYVSK